MNYKNILVLGGTGFVGQRVVECLVTRGHQVCVPTRRRVRGRALFVLPTVEVVEADVTRAEVLHPLVAECDAVINLVGVLHDSSHGRDARYGARFAAAHVQLPRDLVAACREHGVARLVHVSALGADAAGPSGYLRSKGEGERVVLDAGGLASTVLRPSVVFGPQDSFLRLFAALARWLPVLLVGRAQARLQPVSVADLASAVCNALESRASFGHGYEICGPTIYTLGDLVRFAARASGHPRPVIGLPDALAGLMALGFELAPGPTLLSRDNLLSLRVDSIASVQPYVPAPELGFRPAPLEPEASLYLSGLHPRTRFGGFRARARR